MCNGYFKNDNPVAIKHVYFTCAYKLAQISHQVQVTLVKEPLLSLTYYRNKLPTFPNKDSETSIANREYLTNKSQLILNFTKNRYTKDY